MSDTRLDGIEKSIAGLVDTIADMSDNPQSARNYAAVGNGQYIGNAVTTQDRGFMTFDSNFGHNPLRSQPGDFNALASSLLRPVADNILASHSNLNSNVMYMDNMHQRDQAQMLVAIANKMRDSLQNSEALPEGIDASAGARMMAKHLFSGPLTEENLQLMNQFGWANDKGLREGIMKTGISTIGLKQYGAVGSLFQQDRLKDLEAQIKKAAADDSSINELDVLGAATALTDPNADLALSQKSKGYGENTNIGKTTASLKRARELTGMSNRQTLGLLADVYDNVIEGVLPDLDRFIDRMMTLERQGVSVQEFASSVHSMRGKLRRAGVRDSDVAVSVVEEALGNKYSMLGLQHDVGNLGFNQHQYHGGRLDTMQHIAQASETTSAAMLVNLAAGINNSDSPEEKIKKANTFLESPGSEAYKEAFEAQGLLGLHTDFMNGLKLEEAGHRIQQGYYGDRLSELHEAGVGNGELARILKTEHFSKYIQEQTLRHGSGVRHLPDSIKTALLEGNEVKLNEKFAAVQGILSLSNFSDTPITKSVNGKPVTTSPRKAQAKRLGINIDSENGTYSKNDVSIPEADVTRLTAALLVNHLTALNTGRSQQEVNYERFMDDFAEVRGLDRLEALSKVKRDLNELVPEGEGSSKVAASVLLGTVIEAAVAVKGPGEEGSLDFDILSEPFGDMLGWKEAKRELNRKLRANEALKLSGLASDENYIAAAIKQMDAQQEIIDAKGDGVADATTLINLLKREISSSKLGGGDVDRFEGNKTTEIAGGWDVEKVNRVIKSIEAVASGVIKQQYFGLFTANEVPG